MIRFEKVCKSYGEKILFEDLCFSINKSEKCGLVGRNGSGKTTIFRLLTNKEISDSGNISIPNNYSFGYLDQHILFSKDTIIGEAIQSLSSSEDENIYKAEKILFGLGFKEQDMKRDPKEFSGGYQLRLHLAKILLLEPSCLLLDEPTNYLDIVSINWFTRFLKAWKGEFIIISHDRDFLDNVTTHTIGINRNGIEKVKGGTKKLFELILQKEEIQERTRINIDKKRSKAESFITRFSAKSSKAKQAQSRQKSLEKLPALEKLLDLYNLKFSFKSALFPGKKILSAEGVNFSYNNEIKSKAEKDLIENFSIIVEKEDRVAIVGKNGYGKSTILKLLASELKPNAGNIYISENAKIGYFGQTNINRLDPSMTVEEEISASNRMISVGESRSICGQMMFSKDEANKKISVLSGGEKSRVLLGKILAKQCNLLLLDEPTNHLDMESIEALLEALESFPGSVIIVTHSELILRRLSLSKVVICSQTEQELFVGNYDEFLEKKGWPEDFTSKKEKKAIGHKELKKIRAEITRDRANELRDIKKFISNIERNIISREKELEEDNKNLINASNESNSLEIVKLSKSISENQTKIESLFDELDQLSKEHEKIKSYYDSKLKSL